MIVNSDDIPMHYYTFSPLPQVFFQLLSLRLFSLILFSFFKVTSTASQIVAKRWKKANAQIVGKDRWPQMPDHLL